MKSLFTIFLLILLTQSTRTPFESLLPPFSPSSHSNNLQFSVINTRPNLNQLLSHGYSNPHSRLVGLPVSLFDAEIQNSQVQNFYQIFIESPKSPSVLELRKYKRNANGTYNNLKNHLWGSAGIALMRNCPALYLDEKQMPMPPKANPREISNKIGKLSGPIKTSRNNITMFFTIWGQFLDHDLSLTEVDHQQKMDIKIPTCDEFMDLDCSGEKIIPFERSLHTKNQQPRNQINSITAWLDAGQVYGSSEEVASRLRQFKLGRLKEGNERLLPLLKDDVHNSFDAGDIRANENLMLTSMHTIFMREHNRVCKEILKKTPFLTDEQIYQAAKNYVTGIIQKISVYDFLPLMIGKEKFQSLIGPYKGYDESVNPNIQTQFSTLGFRIGHSLLVALYPLINRYGEVEQNLTLNEMFFQPDKLSSSFMEKLLKGMSQTHMKEKSQQIIDEIRNLLIQGPSNRNVNLDLYALNIQRAKDHGIDNYNSIRKAYGLNEVSTFEEITSNPRTLKKLKQVYGYPNECDTWVCILSEDSLQGAVVGQLGATIIGKTFQKIRDGDRFWYERIFPPSVEAQIGVTQLSQVILRNTRISSLKKNIFLWNDD